VQSSFPAAIKEVLRSEGFMTPNRGWTNHKNDNGGPTLAGLTIYNFCEWKGLPPPQKPWNPNLIESMKAVTDDELYRYYYERKWCPVRCDDLPEGVDYAVFDVAVLHGPGKAAQFLRKAVGLPLKGKIDDAVVQAVNDHDDWDEIIRSIAASRRAHYDAIIANNPSQGVFKKGWMTRCARVEATACEMAPDGTTRVQPVQVTDAGRPDETIDAAAGTKPLAQSTTAQASSVSTVASVYSAQSVIKTELAAAQLEGSISWGKFAIGLLTSEVFLASMVAVIGMIYVLWDRNRRPDIAGIFKRQT
jgi:lysozyme family protein